MKLTTITAALVVIAALAARGAEGKSLEDVLKEKGVITEEDYREVTRSRPVDYRLGRGFTFTSPDEKFKGSLLGLLQLRYTLLDLDDANDTVGRQAQDSSKFELRRIKLIFNGHAFSENLNYLLQLNFANLQGGTTNNGGLLEETYVNYRLCDWLQFRFGQDKVQFGREFITSTALLQFVEQSVVTVAFVPGYDTGLMLHGKIAGGLVNYNAGVYGGAGQNTFRATSDNAFAARLTVNPLGDVKYSESDVEYSEKPLVSVAADFFRDTLNPGGSLGLETNNLFFAKSTGWFGIGSPLMPAANRFSAAEALDFNLLGLDAAFKWRGFSAQGEYFIGQADGQSTNHTLRSQGFYAQAGYFVIPKHLELAARYAYLDPNRDVANDLWVETAGAVSWYFSNHNLKLQADYSNIHKQKAIAFNSGPDATDDRQVRFQAQLLF